jgi:hypothetical protein
MNMFKRITSLLAVFMVVLNIVIPLVEVNAATDSNGRISAFISWSAGKEVNVSDFENTKFTQRDLQFLGVYLSNFYVPFGTELGESDELTEMNKTDMVSALQTSLNFDDAVATSFVETILGMSRSSSQELSLYVSNTYQGDMVSVPDVPLNYYTVLSCMLGGLPEIMESYDSTNSVYAGMKTGYYQYGYFCTSDGKPVFDFDLDMSTMTASNTAFIKCLEAVDMENGYGTSFFDFKEGEITVDNDSFNIINGEVTDEQSYQMSAYGMRLSVDCFGNLIINGANHQLIAVPGCMNPYTWKEVDSDGKEISGINHGGTAYNLISVPSLSLQTGQGSNSLFSTISAPIESTTAEVVESGDDTIVIAFDGKLGEKNLISGRSTYLTMFKTLLNYGFGGEDGVEDLYTIGWNGNSLTISGKASDLVKMNPNRLDYDVLDSDPDKYGVIRGVKNNFAQYLDPGVSGNWQTIDSNLTKIYTEAQNKLSGSSDDSSAVSNTKTGEVTIDALKKHLNNMVGKTYPILMPSVDAEYSFRVLRGDSETAIGDGYWSESFGDIKDLFTGEDTSVEGMQALLFKAETGFTTANPKAKNYYLSSKGDGGIAGLNYDELKTLEDIKFYAEVGSGRTISLYDSFVFIDTTGAANYGNDLDYQLFNVAHYNDDKATSFKEAFTSWAKDSKNGYTNMYKDIQEGKSIVPTGMSDEGLISIYVTYAYASLYEDSEVKETIGKLGYKLNVDDLPTVPDTALVLSEEALSDAMLDAIRNWMYYLLHPTEGIDYFRILITNKVNGLLVGIHEDIIGSDSTGLINGTTYYRGDVGYVTTPELSDVSWIARLIDFFKLALPYLIIIVLLLMFAVYLTGGISMQRAIIGTMLFAMCITMILPVINSIVGMSNRFSTELYGERFTYWALVQHQSYQSAIDEAAEKESYENYLRELYAQNSAVSGNQGSESIMLRWQAPKKMASLMFGEDKPSDESSSLMSSQLMSGILGGKYSGENYLDDEDINYLYRSYIDISNFSRYIHRGLTTDVQPINMALANDITYSWYPDLRESMTNFNLLYESDRANGYCNLNADGSTSGDSSSILRVKLPLSSKLVSKAYEGYGTIANMGITDYVGINQDAFNFSIPMFNATSLDYFEVLKTANFDPASEGYTPEDFSALAAYGLMSENPFYYFSWYLYESGLSTESGATNGYKNLLLGQEDAGFFYNVSSEDTADVISNGEMKDFMDMRSLFTYVIPYLKQGNDIVREWDSTYGIFFYEGVSTEEGKEAEYADDPELAQKYWHNLNVARLYNIYTPWVDLMYDCSYANAEKINYLGESYVIEDPINPQSYPDDRPMIFSRTEMADYGLKISQLTTVERKIIETNDGMQERLFNLLNYYTFNDTVLNTAAAMNCAFEFNLQFSENGLLGENYNIYPQSFELSDFSYDAFLRFILSNSTGESMTVEQGQSFYNNVVNHSNTVTAIVMILLDITAVYLLPYFKLLFILGIFILAVLLTLISATRSDNEMNVLGGFVKVLIMPMVSFLAVSVGFAWVVSLFMGSGLVGVTGETSTSISTGDPVIAMVIMLVLNCVAVYLYFKMLLPVWKDVIKGVKFVYNTFSGAVMGLGGAVLSKVQGATSKTTSSTGTPAQASGMMGSSSINNTSTPNSVSSKGSILSVFRDGGTGKSGSSSSSKSGLFDKKGSKQKEDKEQYSEKRKKSIEDTVKEGAKKASKLVDRAGSKTTAKAESAEEVVKTAKKLL